MEQDIERYNPVLAAIRQAATLCQHVQQLRTAKADKGTNDPVTIADYGSQAIICRMIAYIIQNMP